MLKGRTFVDVYDLHADKEIAEKLVIIIINNNNKHGSWLKIRGSRPTAHVSWPK